MVSKGNISGILKKYVAMDITGSSIRVVSVNGNQVRKWISSPVPEGAIKDGMILEPHTVSVIIDSLFKDLKLKKNKVICSLTGMPFIYRVISMPRAESAVSDEAIERAARQEMSLTQEDMHILWQATEANPESLEMDYFVLGVPRTSVRPLEDTLTLAGIKPYIIDVKPLALARAASVRDGLIVSLEKSYYDIILISGGLVRVMHSVSPGSKPVESISIVNDVIDGLNKAIKSFNRDFPQNTLEADIPLMLAGELSVDSEIVDLMQQAIGRPVTILDPVMDAPVDMPREVYATALGLAAKKTRPVTRNLNYRDIDINLLLRGKKASQLGSQLVYAGLGVFIILLAFAVYEAYGLENDASARTQALKAEQANVAQILDNDRKANTQALAAKQTSTEQLKTMTDQLTAVQADTKQIMGQAVDYAGNFNTIINSFPAGATYTNITMQSNNIVVSGQVLDPFNVLDFTDALTRTNDFSDIIIDSITPIKGTDGANFEVTITR